MDVRKSRKCGGIMIKESKKMKKKGKKIPQNARPGVSNPNYKHGDYVREKRLTPEDLARIQKLRKEYLEAYPYLDEPIMLDLLHEYLLIKLRLEYINAWVHNPNIAEEDKLGAEKRVDSLRRTYSLLATRMGISYVSRQRRREKVKRQLPMDLIREGDQE